MLQRIQPPARLPAGPRASSRMQHPRRASSRTRTCPCNASLQRLTPHASPACSDLRPADAPRAQRPHRAHRPPGDGPGARHRVRAVEALLRRAQRADCQAEHECAREAAAWPAEPLAHTLRVAPHAHLRVYHHARCCACCSAHCSAPFCSAPHPIVRSCLLCGSRCAPLHCAGPADLVGPVSNFKSQAKAQMDILTAGALNMLQVGAAAAAGAAGAVHRGWVVQGVQRSFSTSCLPCSALPCTPL